MPTTPLTLIVGRYRADSGRSARLGKSFALDGDGWEGGAVHVETSNGIVLEYDTFGDPDDPAILLIMGFGTQLLGWDADFCRLLASRGHYVIRYDNRDCGLSTKYDGVPVDLMDFIGAVRSGDVDRAQAMSPYTLRDMASDGIALLRELGVPPKQLGTEPHDQ